MIGFQMAYRFIALLLKKPMNPIRIPPAELELKILPYLQKGCLAQNNFLIHATVIMRIQFSNRLRHKSKGTTMPCP
jgi:hypothetical protein